MSFYYLTKKLVEVYYPEACEEVTRFVPAVPSGGGGGGGDEHCYETTVQTTVPVVSADGNTGELEIGNYNDEIAGTITIDKVITICTTDGVPSDAEPVDGGYNITETVCTPAHTKLEPDIGWSASARSISTFINDCSYEFQVDENVSGIITGFSNQAVTEYEHIRWGLYFSGGRARVMEFGQLVSHSWDYSASDVYKIERIGSVVRYYQDDTLQYTSTDQDNGPMVGNAVMYVTSERLNDATFTQLGQLADASGMEAQPASMEANDFDTSTDQYAHLGAPPGVVDAASYGVGDGAMAASAPEMFASQSSTFAYAEMYAAPADVEGTNINFTPAYAVGSMSGAAADANAWGQRSWEGNASIDAAGAHMLASNYDYAEVDALAAPGVGQGWKLDGLQGTLILAIPSIDVSGVGFRSGGTFTASIPTIDVSGYMGGDGLINIPGIDLTVTGINNGLGVGLIEVPTLSVSGIAVNRGFGTFSEQLPFFTLSGFGSGAGTVNIPVFGVTGAGTTRFIGTGSVSMPIIDLTATALYNRAGSGSLEIPSITIADVATGDIQIPIFALVGLGGTPAAQQYAYAVNTINQAISRWTHSPFSELIRIGNRYFGLINTTVYELTGDLNHDDSTIDMLMRTFSSDMGTSNLKKVTDAWFNARTCEGISLTPITDERRRNTLRTRPTADNRIENKHLKMARGIDARHWAFEITNINGDNLYLHSAELRSLIKSKKGKR